MFHGEAHDKEQLINRLQKIWTASLIEETKRRAEKGEITEVPGATEFIAKLRQNGWKIAVVTQAPFEYALAVLQSLGLVDNTIPHEDDKLLMQGNNIIDAIVSGEMVEKPKPDPEPLLRAAFLVDLKSQIRSDVHIHNDMFEVVSKIPLTDSTLKPRAIIGDSRSDINAGKALDIFTLLINSRRLSCGEIRSINPDSTILSYSDLTPSILEGKIDQRGNQVLSKEKR